MAQAQSRRRPKPHVPQLVSAPGLPDLYQVADHALCFDGDGRIQHETFQLVMPGAMEEIRASNAEAIAQNRCCRLPTGSSDYERPYNRIHFRAVVHCEDVLGSNPIGGNETGDQTHSDLTAALEKRMARRGGNILGEKRDGAQKQYEEVAQGICLPAPRWLRRRGTLTEAKLGAQTRLAPESRQTKPRSQDGYLKRFYAA